MDYKLVAYALDFVSFLLHGLGEESEAIRQIILFGSVARGEAGKKSDVDLFIETDAKKEERINQLKEEFYQSVKMRKYWRLLGVKREISCSVGLLEEWPDLERSLAAQGVVLYGKYQGKAQRPYFLFTLAQSRSRNKNIALWRKLYGYRQKKGRRTYEQRGLVKKYSGEKLAKGVFIVPAEHGQKVVLFLQKNKIKYRLFSFGKD